MHDALDGRRNRGPVRSAAQKLREEQRIALRPLDASGRDARVRGEIRAGKCERIARRQRPQVADVHGDVERRGAERVALVARRAHDEQRRRARDVDQRTHPGEHDGRRPMHVLHDDHQRPLRGHVPHHARERAQAAFAARRVVHRLVHRGVALRHGQDVRGKRLVLRRNRAGRHRAIERRAPIGCTRFRRHREKACEQGVDRIAALRHAEVEHRACVRGESAPSRVHDHLLHEARLAHAGIGPHDPCVARAGDLHGLQERLEARDLVVAAEERMLGGGIDAQRAQLPDGHLLREPADRHRRDVVDLDRRHARTVDVVRDHGFAGVRDLEEAGRQIDGVARHRVVAMHGAAGVGGDHLAGCHTDVRGQRAAVFLRERLQRLVNGGGGAQRAHGVVAVRDRRAEQRHHAVAHVLVHRTAALLDQAVDQLEVAREEPVHAFGAELVGERRRSAEVREQDRDHPTLRGRCARCRARTRERASALRAEARGGRRGRGTARTRSNTRGHGAILPLLDALGTPQDPFERFRSLKDTARLGAPH